MLTLVLGGAASGKSEYAEALVLRSTLPRYYLATMQVWDAECAARVEKHRRMRAAKQFETIECPLHLETVHLPRRGTALLEDLGNLTANELYDPAGAGDAAAEHILQGLDALAAQCENLIVVSNEVFSGGADYVGDTDRYLLALARVNNALAARADAVVRVVCGIPVYYKGVENDRFADHCGGLCHVFGGAGAAVWVERKEYAVCAVRLPAGGAFMRGAVVRVRGAASACPGAGCWVLPCSGMGDRRHPSGRLCRHLRRPCQLRRPGKEAGNFKRPALRCLCGHPAVQLFCGLPLPCRLRAVHPPGGRAVDAGAGAGAGTFRPCGGSLSYGQKYRPCPHFCNCRRPHRRAQCAGSAGSAALRCAAGFRRRGTGRCCNFAVFVVSPCSRTAAGRHYRRFGRVVLQKTELWMLAALCACQWGGLL